MVAAMVKENFGIRSFYEKVQNENANDNSQKGRYKWPHWWNTNGHQPAVHLCSNQLAWYKNNIFLKYNTSSRHHQVIFTCCSMHHSIPAPFSKLNYLWPHQVVPLYEKLRQKYESIIFSRKLIYLWPHQVITCTRNYVKTTKVSSLIEKCILLF